MVGAVAGPEDHRRRQEWGAVQARLQTLRRRASGLGDRASEERNYCDWLRTASERHSHESQIVAEAYFLLMAIDHLHRIGPFYGSRTDPRVKAAIRTFEKDFGQAAVQRGGCKCLRESRSSGKPGLMLPFIEK